MAVRPQLKASQPDAPPSRDALVLVVDDEASICKTLASVLRDEGFEAITASDGAEALEQIRIFKPDVVFLDIWMPGWDGIETLEKIKASSPETQVVMISGHATISNALEAMKRGAFDFIEKPFDIESVILAATRALKRSSSPDEGPDFTAAASLANDRPRRQPVSTPPPAAVFRHQGMSSPGLRGRNFGQRTLRESVILYGHCLHSGMKSGLVLEPLPPDSGLQYAQMGNSKPVPVYVDYVESTQLATTVRSGSTQVATIEHLMAALHVYRISNLLIKCNGEIPIFDGSAEQFCSIIESVGITEQGGDWFEVAVDEPLSFAPSEGGGREMISIEPADELTISYELDYPKPIGKQQYTFTLDGVSSFREEIASARTFGFMKDAERLQRAGLAAGARLDNFLLIGPDKVVNTELRFENEPVRHKILDILGDIFLIGRPIRGKITARMTGHSDNVQLLRLINERLFESV